MGVTIITALEIAGNAEDLRFSIPEENGQFGVLITRGPGHRFKLMISGPLVLASREDAIAVIRDEVLEPILHHIAKERLESKLTPEVTEKILAGLRATGTAQTFA